jgi:phosphoribosylamine-glycine ligase
VDGQLVSAGGRVLGVTAAADTLQEALDRAYQAMAEIHFDGMYYRRDIGHRALKRTF